MRAGSTRVIAAATLIGLGLNFLGVNPIAALVYTAVINGIVAVPLLVLLLLIANNRAIMGDFTNRRLSNSRRYSDDRRHGRGGGCAGRLAAAA